MSNLIAEMQILLRKNKELQAERDKLLRTMNLHVGDICSLNNDVEYFRGLKEEAEDGEWNLRTENERLKDGLIKICGSDEIMEARRFAREALEKGGK